MYVRLKNIGSIKIKIGSVLPLEEKVIKEKAETIINCLNGKEARQSDGFANLGECILGLSIIKSAVDEVYKNILACIDIMDSMAGEGLLVPGTHFDIISEAKQGQVLRLNYKLFYMDFLRYCHEKHREQAVFSDRQFQSLLKGMPFCRAHNSPVYFCEGYGSSSKKLFRSAILDILMLQMDGVHIENFLEKGLKHGGI